MDIKDIKRAQEWLKDHDPDEILETSPSEFRYFAALLDYEHGNNLCKERVFLAQELKELKESFDNINI